MPSKATKIQKKKNKQNNDPEIVRGTVTVRDCMTWHYPDGYKPENDRKPESNDFFLPTKPDIGQSKNRGYQLPPIGQTSHIHDENGRVIDALRGWPQTNTDETANERQSADPRPSGESPNKKGDPWMGDLIAHKFMTDAIRKRQEEEEAAARKAAGRSKKSGRARTDIKANRTSQLRSIAVAEKVEVSPQELWQMSKFKKNAKPHLDTQNRRVRRQNDRDQNGNDVNDSNGTGGGDPCTCYDNKPEVFDDKLPETDIEETKNYDGHANDNMYPYYNDDTDDSKLFAV